MRVGPKTGGFTALALSMAISEGIAFADPPMDRAIVVQALSGYEQAPLDATVRAWGDPGAQALIDVASDNNAATHVRLRAVYALRLFAGSAAVHTYLKECAAESANTLLFRRAAMDALAEGFADVTEVSRYLQSPDVSIRDGAAWSLSRMHTPAARTAIQTALHTETHPTVRATMQRALR